MEKSRRGFLRSLGIGTFIAGSAGLFTLSKEVKLATPLEVADIKNFDQQQLIDLANDMLNSIDGQPVKNSFIANFVRQQIIQGAKNG